MRQVNLLTDAYEEDRARKEGKTTKHKDGGSRTTTKHKDTGSRTTKHKDGGSQYPARTEINYGTP